MHLHIVGGFLGSGKTTAIIGAARYLMTLGKRVGVVTNDQGRYLVDTAFFRLGEVPAVEVTGGCFCCNYDDLDARLDHLRTAVDPDVIFAESVGSCADIVATVINPLSQLRGTAEPTSFSVFTDIRLLKRRLLGQALPFSDDVVYIFDKQIEEAGLLVINKSDLLLPVEAEDVLELARQSFRSKRVRLQSSLLAESTSEWVDLLESGSVPAAVSPLDIDYERYGTGESRLAWLDEKVTMRVPEGSAQQVVTRALAAVAARLDSEGIPIGHVKALVEWDGGSVKVSFPALPVEDWHAGIPPIPGRSVSLLVNARAETEAGKLKRVVQEAIGEVIRAAGGTYDETGVAAFHPAAPRPTHRM